MPEPNWGPGPWEILIGGNFVRVGAAGYRDYTEREHYLGGPLCIAEINDKATTDYSQDHELAIIRAHLIEAAPDLYAALEAIMGMISSGVLVRNVSADVDPGYAMRQLPLVMALKHSDAALAKARGEGEKS